MKCESFFHEKLEKLEKRKSTEKKLLWRKSLEGTEKRLFWCVFCLDKTISFLNNFKLKERNVFLNLKYTAYESFVVKIGPFNNEEFYNKNQFYLKSEKDLFSFGILFLQLKVMSSEVICKSCKYLIGIPPQINA